jgi:hypothetical protein
VADLCNGLITDKAVHASTSVTKPAAGQSFVDPQFGTTIRRITNVGSGGVLKPMYSTTQAWNADESYMILYHTSNVSGRHELYQGKAPYSFIKVLDIDPSDLEQVWWHTTDRDILFYPSGNQLIRYHVSTGAKDVLHTFSDCTGSISGDSHGFTSFDSKVVGLKCSSNNKAYVFNMSTNQVLGTATRPSGADAPLVAPSGNLAYWNGYVYNASLVQQFSLNLAATDEHTSLGRLANGHDTHNAISFDGAYVGSLVVHDMTAGTARVVIGPSTGYPYPPVGTHVSAVAFNQPGWVAVSVTGDYTNGKLGQGVLENEIALANTNSGGSVCRVAHTRTSGKEYSSNGYWAEAHASISPSGTRIVFGSDWNNSGSVDTYIVELPSYKP